MMGVSTSKCLSRPQRPLSSSTLNFAGTELPPVFLYFRHCGASLSLSLPGGAGRGRVLENMQIWGSERPHVHPSSAAR